MLFDIRVAFLCIRSIFKLKTNCIARAMLILDKLVRMDVYDPARDRARLSYQYRVVCRMMYGIDT